MMNFGFCGKWLPFFVLFGCLHLSFSTTCPPEGFNALKELDFKGYIEARWYSLKQIEVSFQPRRQFYCVFAQYTDITRSSLLCKILGCKDPPTIRVLNSARSRSVDGLPVFVVFQGVLTDPKNAPAKVQVSFPLIPRQFRRGSNYWVVAAGKYSDLPSQSNQTTTNDTYDYAIITTGAPNKVGKNGCYSDGGMWLFSRDPNPPMGVIEDIETIAQNLGLSTHEWLPVKHKGCMH